MLFDIFVVLNDSSPKTKCGFLITSFKNCLIHFNFVQIKYPYVTLLIPN